MGGSRWTEADVEKGAEALAYYYDEDPADDMHLCAVREVLHAVFPVGEPDASQETINGLLDAVERLNGQKDALRRENGQLRELLDLPVGERVEAVAEWVGEPDDDRVLEAVAEALWRHAGFGTVTGEKVFAERPDFIRLRWLGDARAAVAAVRASQENPEWRST